MKAADHDDPSREEVFEAARRASKRLSLRLSTLTAETEDLRARLAGIQESTSWKLTLPLRRVVAAAKYYSRTAVAQVRAKEASASPSLRPREKDYSVAVPFGYDVTHSSTPRVAAVCHVYYEDLAHEMLTYLDNTPFATDVFISTDTEAKRSIIYDSFALWDKGSVEVRVTPNCGRDIAPKLVGLGDVHEKYEYVVHLHTKQTSPEWRRFLFRTLIGSPDIVRSIFAAFACEPGVGIIFPQHWEYVRHLIYWAGDIALPRLLAARMGFELKADRMLEYPSGSMFWARSDALRPLLDLGLSFDDFRAVARQSYTLEHSIEGLFLHACERAGFTWLKIAVPSLFSDQRNIVNIASPAELQRFVRDRTVRLLT